MVTIEDIYGIDNTDLYTFHDSIRGEIWIVLYATIPYSQREG